VTTALERLAIVVASLVLSVGLIALLSGYFAGKDQAGVSGGDGGPGIAFRDLGHAQLAPGQLRPLYDSSPPTSGPHVAGRVTRQGQQLNDDQLLQALQLGNVVVIYGTNAAPPGLDSFTRSVAAPFTSALAAAGQAVIEARRPGVRGLIGLAWTHLVQVSSPRDPLLHSFAQFWLGRGAPGH
jgi:hypothetical protein